MRNAIFDDHRHRLQPIALRAREAAEVLGISERLLARLTKDSGVPVVRLGRVVVYPRAGLEEWLAAKTINTTSPHEPN